MDHWDPGLFYMLHNDHAKYFFFNVNSPIYNEKKFLEKKNCAGSNLVSVEKDFF